MRSIGCGTWAAIVLTVFTVGYGIWVQSLAWEEQASFDILGFLYLLSNIPNLIAWALLLVFMCLTIWAWFLVVSERRQAELDWSEDLPWVGENSPPTQRD
jgi:hypothetical protein